MSEPGVDARREEHEAALMRAVGAGDPQAYRQLTDRHFTTIYRFAARLLVDRAEAEDVTQETFLRLWQHAGTWTPKASVSTWLHRVAKNLAIDRLRRRRPESGAEVDELPASQRPGTLLLRKRVAERVQAALEQLPVRQRVALTLVHYQGLSQLEAAEVMELSVRALESLLARGRRALRQQLAELDGPPSERRESESSRSGGDV